MLPAWKGTPESSTASSRPLRSWTGLPGGYAPTGRGPRGRARGWGPVEAVAGLRLERPRLPGRHEGRTAGEAGGDGRHEPTSATRIAGKGPGHAAGGAGPPARARAPGGSPRADGPSGEHGRGSGAGEGPRRGRTPSGGRRERGRRNSGGSWRRSGRRGFGPGCSAGRETSGDTLER
jgi:hypothetical protein